MRPPVAAEGVTNGEKTAAIPRGRGEGGWRAAATTGGTPVRGGARAGVCPASNNWATRAASRCGELRDGDLRWRRRRRVVTDDSSAAGAPTGGRCWLVYYQTGVRDTNQRCDEGGLVGRVLR